MQEFFNTKKIIFRGKEVFQVDFVDDIGRRKRHIFHSQAVLDEWMKNRKILIAQKTKSALGRRYSVAQIRDIDAAMSILPKGATLLDAVKNAFFNKKKKDLNECLAEYIEIKKSQVLERGYARALFSRLNDIPRHFQNLDDITSRDIVDALKSIHLSPKTIQHYRAAWGGFFDFCFRRDYIFANPMDKILQTDLPKVIKLAPRFLTVRQTIDFLSVIKKNYPQFLKFYAIALFAGIRIAEIKKMKNADILLSDKKIILPAENVKTRKSFILENLECNLWTFLADLKNDKIIYPTNHQKERICRLLPFKLPHNFARHSFATYHLSKYLDPIKTAAITRHSVQMLNDHYIGGRVEKKIAEEFFSITPEKLLP